MDLTLNSNQNSGEKPSCYLQQLQTALSKVGKRGGIAASDSGCHANDDINIATAADRASPMNAQKLEKQLAKLQAEMASLKASLGNGSSQTSA